MLAKPDFTAVAKAIANPPPDWLPNYLEQSHAFIRNKPLSKGEYRHLKQLVGQMHHSMDLLIRWLPVLKGIPGLGDWPDVAADVETATTALTRLKAELNRRPLRTGRRPSNVMQQWCADVVIEAWKDIYGDVKPRSSEVLEACAAYWEACGHPTRDADNWGRDTKHAIANPNKVVQTFLILHKTRV
jgi:hypothetical protein